MPGHRFYLPSAKFTADTAIIDGDEAHHLRRVLRLGAGDEVRVFDGRGREFQAVIDSVSSSTATVRLLKELDDNVESPLAFTLAQGLIKGDKFDLVIQKAVELGVRAILPLTTAHSDVQLSDTRAEKRLERWQRIALEATKQSGRRTLTEILPPQDWDGFLADKHENVVLFAERGGRALNDIVQELKAREVSTITAVVGSEGGWSELELAAARRAEFQLATLGPRILRAETAGITVSALLQYLCGDLS